MRNDHLSGPRREARSEVGSQSRASAAATPRRFTTDNRPEPSTTKRRARRAP
jgi:hypothetical protein